MEYNSGGVKLFNLSTLYNGTYALLKGVTHYL